MNPNSPLPSHLCMHKAERFCNLQLHPPMPSTMPRLLWFFISLWTVSSCAAAVAAEESTDCSSVIPSVMSCLDFVSDGSTVPTPVKDCCAGIGAVINDIPDCLCEAIKLAPTMGNLNMTRILALPDACSLKTPDLECIRNATHPPSPVPSPPMPSPAPTPALVPTPPPSTTPAPSHSPPATPVAPVPPPKTPPTSSPQPSVPTPPEAPSAPPAPPVDPADAPVPAPSGTSKSADAVLLSSCIALAGSAVLVLSGLMS